MAKIRTLIVAIVFVFGSVTAIFVNAQNNSETKITEQDQKVISEYRYKAIKYSAIWDASNQKFETFKQVFFFNQWTLDGENKWTADCSNKGIYVILHDGVYYIDGKLQKFTSLKHSNGEYRCYDETKMVIVDTWQNNETVWRNYY